MVLSLFCFVSIGYSQTKQLTVVQEKAPLFKERSISSPIIRYLEKGSKVNLLSAEESFYLVSYGGYEGWMIPYSVVGADDGEAQTDSKPESEITDQQVEIKAEPVETQPQPDLSSDRYLIVINSYANVREGPGINFKKIGRVYQGEKLEKFIKRGRWYRVRLPNSLIGFIREDLVSDPGQTPAVPVRAESYEPSASTDYSQAPQQGSEESLERRIDRLERELSELRRMFLDYIRNDKNNDQAAVQNRMSGSSEVTTGIQQSSSGKVSASNADISNTERKIIGNTATRVYHLPASIFYDKIPEEFRVYFESEEEAVKAGYTKSIR